MASFEVIAAAGGCFEFEAKLAEIRSEFADKSSTPLAQVISN
jgi:hypothetical protein